MAQGTGSINSDYKDWEWSDDAGERARLLQSPSVETVPKNSESQGNGLGATSALGAVFIVVNAALGAGLLNFPAAFSMAGGVAAGIGLQMVREWRRDSSLSHPGRICGRDMWCPRKGLGRTRLLGRSSFG